MPLIAKKNLFQSAWVILRTMKRLIIALVLVAGFCCAGFAEEMDSADVTYRTTSGGFWSCGQDFSGGFEFQYLQGCAFVVEFGGQNRMLTGKFKNEFKDYARSNPVLSFGFRTFR